MFDSLTGKLLVAASSVADPMYAGGVCLIVHHDEQNLIGVMLNRPLKPSAEALAAMLGHETTSQPGPKPEARNRLVSMPTTTSTSAAVDQAGDGDLPSPWRFLHFGGPLSGPVVAVHPLSQYGDVETGQGIYLAAQKDHLEQLVRETDAPCRLIVGHLGWEVDQLQEEIDQGIWHLLPATADAVFSPAQEMWSRLIRRATTGSLARWIGVKDVPQAAELN